MYLLYLDRHHQEDLLFVPQLARTLAAAGPRRPRTALVHGSGEYVERMLEGQGRFVERAAGGALVPGDAEEARLVERGVREMNQKLVATLTDELVPAVGVQGADRGLLRHDGDAVVLGRGGWLCDLAAQGVVPVVSALAQGAAGASEAAPGAALAALAGACSDGTAVLLARRGADVVPEDGLRRSADADALAEAVPEPDVLRALAARGVPVLVTRVDAFLHESGPRGTLLRWGS